MEQPKKKHKPIHSVKKDASSKDPIYNALLHDAASKDAQAKLDDLSLHLPGHVDTFLTSEQDDDEIRFYVGISIPF